MEFHPWQTMVDEYRKIRKSDGSIRKLNLAQLYLHEVNAILHTAFRDKYNQWKRIVRCLIERQWESDGRPYYNLHPQLVRMLCRTNLEKIPAEFIEMPTDLKVVNFRFAEDVPIYHADSNGPQFWQDNRFNEMPIAARSVLFGKYSARNDDLLSRPLAAEFSGSEQFIVCIDEGCRVRVEEGERMLCNTFLLSSDLHNTIPEAVEYSIARAPNPFDGILLMTYRERIENLFRVIISSCCLANTPEENLVVPDVLADDRNAFSEAKKKGDQARMNTIVSRAHRRGKKGWNIGTNEVLLGQMGRFTATRAHDTGKELQWSHLRRFHPHAVRHGEGKKKVKIKFYRTTRVRPDLPFKPENPE